MKKEEILAMKAGRQLDALVAEKVMNLCIVDTLQLYGDGCLASDKCIDEWLNHPEYGKTADPDSLEPYSSNISAAWVVLEKFPISMIERIEVFEGHITINVSLYSSTKSEKVYTASSNSFALSVSKAALLAVMDS